MTTGRAQKVDEEKIGSFTLISCLLPELCLLKCQNGTFLVFSADSSKKSVTVWVKYPTAPKRSYLVLSETAMFDRLSSYRS